MDQDESGSKKARRLQLVALGFKPDWINLIARRHPLLFANSTEKVQGLKGRGFDDPVKLIIRAPQILGLTLKNIDSKLEGLKQLGFGNPVKIIASFPSALGFRLENIESKLE